MSDTPAFIQAAAVVLTGLVTGSVGIITGRMTARARRYEGDAAIIDALIKATEFSQIQEKRWRDLVGGSSTTEHELLSRYVAAAEKFSRSATPVLQKAVPHGKDDSCQQPQLG